MPEPPTDPVERPRTPGWVKMFGVVLAVLAVIVVLMLTGVLGQDHGPGRHGRGANPDGVAAVHAGAPVDESYAVRTVRVTASDAMTFQPVTVTVSAGEVVTFAVTNSGRSVHEFTIGDAAMQRQHAEMMAHMQGRMPHGFPNSVTVQPGETDHLTWRFGDAATLEYACHIPGHYEAGMRGRITVS